MAMPFLRHLPARSLKNVFQGASPWSTATLDNSASGTIKSPANWEAPQMKIVGVAIILALACAALWAQATSQIQGIVLDSSGAVVPGRSQSDSNRHRSRPYGYQRRGWALR